MQQGAGRDDKALLDCRTAQRLSAADERAPSTLCDKHTAVCRRPILLG